jgi:hypothetical protein
MNSFSWLGNGNFVGGTGGSGYAEVYARESSGLAKQTGFNFVVEVVEFVGIPISSRRFGLQENGLNGAYPRIVLNDILP